jgi:hypothetical protein
MFARPGFGIQENVIGARSNVGSGGEQLRPQRVRSAEFMASGFVSRVVFEASVYGQEVEDRIAFRRFGNHFVAENRDRPLRGLGAEAVVRLALERLRPYVRGSVHRNFDDKQEGETTSQPESKMPAYPTWTAIAGVDARVALVPVNVNVEVVHVGERESTQPNAVTNNNKVYTLRPYTRVDMTLSTTEFALPPSLGETFVALRAYNLLYNRYTEPGFGGLDYPVLGRTFLFELRQAF